MVAIDKSHLKGIYRQRFVATQRAQRVRVWKVLCKRWFQRYVGANDVVLDLAAGYCDFINHINCGTKIAVDLNDDVRQYANSDVRIVLAFSDDIAEVESDSIDTVFVSNFFEHLPDKGALVRTLAEIRRILRVQGRVLILQPNIRLVGGSYWDFIDHYLPLTDRSIVEALQIVGLEPIEVRRRFLPYTMNSRIPKPSWLVWLYLVLPPARFVMGKQSFLVARKPAEAL